jgi:hypothetical protein
VDDRLVVEWPNGRSQALVSPEVVEEWAAESNRLRDELDRAVRLMRDLLYPKHPDREGSAAAALEAVNAYLADHPRRVMGDCDRRAEPTPATEARMDRGTA